MKAPHDPIPLSVFGVRVVRLVVQHHEASVAHRDPFPKVRHVELRRRSGPGAEHGCDGVGFGALLHGPVVELLNVRQEQRSFCVRLGAIATQNSVKIPEDAEVTRHNGICVEDATAREIGSEPLMNDDVWCEHQERPGVVLGGSILSLRVEKLPRHGERDDLRLAAPRRHLDRVASKGVGQRARSLVQIECVAL